MYNLLCCDWFRSKSRDHMVESESQWNAIQTGELEQSRGGGERTRRNSHQESQERVRIYKSLKNSCGVIWIYKLEQI